MLSKTPLEYPSQLLEKAKALAAIPTVIVNAVNEITLSSAKLAFDAGLIAPILVGDIDQMSHAAARIEWDLSGTRLIDAKNEAEAARRAVELVSAGEASSIMKGHIHTNTLLRAVISRNAGLRTSSRFSHLFHMTTPGCDKALHHRRSHQRGTNNGR